MQPPATDRITLRCSKCQAKLRTSRQQLGQRGTCPRCGQRIVVRVQIPSDSDIALVPDRRESEADRG